MSPETLLGNPQLIAALLIGFGVLSALVSVIVGSLVRGGPAAPVVPAPRPAQDTWTSKTTTKVEPLAPVVVPTPSPAPKPPPPVITIKGKISTFGGPADVGSQSGSYDPEEGLALYEESQAAGRPDLFPSIGKGLFRRLDPRAYYVAARFDYAKTSKSWLRSHKIKITANGKSVEADAVDWGPHINTGRALDISPGVAAVLGLKTDDEATAEIPLPPSVALPQDRPGGTSWLARAVALRGLYERQGTLTTQPS